MIKIKCTFAEREINARGITSRSHPTRQKTGGQEDGGQASSPRSARRSGLTRHKARQ
jgi:hypothetical protein